MTSVGGATASFPANAGPAAQVADFLILAADLAPVFGDRRIQKHGAPVEPEQTVVSARKYHQHIEVLLR